MDGRLHAFGDVRVFRNGIGSNPTIDMSAPFIESDGLEVESRVMRLPGRVVEAEYEQVGLRVNFRQTGGLA